MRAVTRKVHSHLAQHQKRARMRRRLRATVIEARDRQKQPKLHAHIIVVLPNGAARDKVCESVNSSRAYRTFGEAVTVRAKRVWRWSGLLTYLLKEATPQAWFGARKSFRRVGGSIPLGERGGNRVVLSRDLRDALVRSGRVKPYVRSYAKRRTKRQIELQNDLVAKLRDQHDS